jgi:hypothetical protein
LPVQWQAVEAIGMWQEVLERFEQQAPVGVMARVALEQALPAGWIDTGQWVVVATTMERLLGHFLQASMRARYSPDEVRLDDSTGKIELRFRNRPLADLQAISPPPVSTYALDRAEEFLFRVDGFGSEDQLHERLCTWLRLAYASISSELGHVRIPCAAGWLRAACHPPASVRARREA